MMRVHPSTAIAQAEELRTWMLARPISPVLREVVHRTVANPLATSDTLLVLADAVRPVAPTLHLATAYTALADELARLAPSRATPL
jgi:hypothetical protein